MDSKENPGQGTGHVPTPSPQGAHFASHLSSLLTGPALWLTGDYCHLSQSTALPLCPMSHSSLIISL